MARYALNVSKIISILKVMFYIVVVFGLVTYGYGLYVSSNDWRITVDGVPRIDYVSGPEVKITTTLDIYNPSGNNVNLYNVWYSVYIDNYYVGEGFMPYVILHPGNNKINTSITIEILDLPCNVARALSNNDTINITVKGYAVFQLKLYGKINYKQLTVSFNKTISNVEFPNAPPAADEMLRLLVTVCDSPQDIVTIITSTGGSQYPFMP
ncbi:MAG: hypothetical protein GSR72_06880 [Desulfurococcales archaeon]|nr:hypothetical protein [Desulfurococcales archaeon]MEB3789598.1 hypothetical protein [Desulfurococcales archaeon]